MGAHGNRHGQQRRRNTPKTKGNKAGFFRMDRDLARRDDEEDLSYISHVLRSTESGYIKRKYNS